MNTIDPVSISGQNDELFGGPQSHKQTKQTKKIGNAQSKGLEAIE